MEKKTFLVAYKNVAFYNFTLFLFLVICYVFIKYKSLLLPAQQAAFLCLMCLGGKRRKKWKTPLDFLFIGKEGKLFFVETSKLNGFLMLTG